MTPPEIMCPAPPPPPPTLAPNSPTNGHTDDRADLLQAIRCGTTLKKVPQEKTNADTENGTSPRINGVVNGNSTKEPPKTIKGMDSVQEELCNHLKAKENGTLKKKPPVMQPIVKRLLTEKPTESARKDDSERRMMNHGKRNFVVQKSMPNGVSEKKIEEPKEAAEKKVFVSIKPFEAENKEVQEFKRVSESLKPIQTTTSTPPDTPDRVQSPEREVKVLEKEKETKKQTVTLKPLQMPQKSPEPMSPQRVNSVDISKIIRTPTTPQSPAATRVKMNHGKPNYTLPTRIKTPKVDSRKLPLEFLAVKLRETPNSPLQETVPLAVDSPSGDTSHLPPFRSVTLGRKRENPPPSPLVPAAPTYDTPKYDQKIVVSFAMDLAATPNRYPDHVKKSPVQNGAEASAEVADLRQKKFTIDPNRLSVREQ